MYLRIRMKTFKRKGQRDREKRNISLHIPLVFLLQKRRTSLPPCANAYPLIVHVLLSVPLKYEKSNENKIEYYKRRRRRNKNNKIK